MQLMIVVKKLDSCRKVGMLGVEVNMSETRQIMRRSKTLEQRG